MSADVHAWRASAQGPCGGGLVLADTSTPRSGAATYARESTPRIRTKRCTKPEGALCVRLVVSQSVVEESRSSHDCWSARY